jgi:hypothetical protein
MAKNRSTCKHPDKYPIAYFMDVDVAYLVIYCEDCDSNTVIVGDPCGSLEE